MNITSTKKRDTMLQASAGPDPITNYGLISPNSRLVLPGDRPTYFFPFLATARPCATGQDGFGTKLFQATRSATTCYMRGLSEMIKIETASSVPWTWRRIAFTMKGTDFFTDTMDPSVGDTNPYFRQITGSTPGSGGNNYGMVRPWVQVDATAAAIFGPKIFRGTAGIDWGSIIEAKLDPTRITVKYDKIRIIRSGNDAGTIRQYKVWHPMNHNLVYDDDESGDIEQSAYISTTGKAGMGDYWIVDMFRPLLGSGPGDELSVSSETTLYWHEK